MDMIDRLCLTFEPWCDRDDPSIVLRDQFVVTRKTHYCIHCESEIPQRSRVRARTETIPKEVTKTFYFCLPCCEAMSAANQTGNIDFYWNRQTENGI